LSHDFVIDDQDLSLTMLGLDLNHENCLALAKSVGFLEWFLLI